MNEAGVVFYRPKNVWFCRLFTAEARFFSIRPEGKEKNNIDDNVIFADDFAKQYNCIIVLRAKPFIGTDYKEKPDDKYQRCFYKAVEDQITEFIRELRKREYET